RRIEEHSPGVVEGRRHKGRVRAAEDDRLRAFERHAYGSHIVEMPDHSELWIPRPGEPRNELRVDCYRDVLLAGGHVLLEEGEETPGLPAQDVDPPVVLVERGIGLPQPQRITVTLDGVRTRPRAQKVGFEITGQLRVLVNAGRCQQGGAAVASA